MNNGKWTYNYETDAERWDCEEEFDTKAEAIAAARERAPEYAHENYGDDAADYLENCSFDVGQICAVHFDIDAERIIEDMQEQFGDQCGDVSEYWMETPKRPYWRDRTDEEKSEFAQLQEAHQKNINTLSDRLHDVVEEWLKEIGETPNFSSIENAEALRIKETP